MCALYHSFITFYSYNVRIPCTRTALQKFISIFHSENRIQGICDVLEWRSGLIRHRTVSLWAAWCSDPWQGCQRNHCSTGTRFGTVHSLFYVSIKRRPERYKFNAIQSLASHASQFTNFLTGYFKWPSKCCSIAKWFVVVNHIFPINVTDVKEWFVIRMFRIDRTQLGISPAGQIMSDDTILIDVRWYNCTHTPSPSPAQVKEYFRQHSGQLIHNSHVNVRFHFYLPDDVDGYPTCQLVATI